MPQSSSYIEEELNTYGQYSSSSLFDDPSGKIPAPSKTAIDAVPRVTVTEEGRECCICLKDLEVGAEAMEIPCKHMFHSPCIETWLLKRASCPLCRSAMPIIPLQEEEAHMYTTNINMPLQEEEAHMYTTNINMPLQEEAHMYTTNINMKGSAFPLEQYFFGGYVHEDSRDIFDLISELFSYEPEGVGLVH